MKHPAVVVVAVALTLSACSGSSTAVVVDTAPSPSAVTTTTRAATAPSPASTATASHTPVWLTVKYRSDPVDVAHPRFVHLDGGSSSLVDFAFYDASNEYMVISLNGTAYHYCGMPDRGWLEFTTASSLGSFYEGQIKGRYDCRTGVVPEYN